VSEPEVLKITLPHLCVTALAWGPADGTLALLIHGFPDSAWSWREVAPILAARGYRVIAPFTRGYSPTEVPADKNYTLGALMYDVLALHRYFGGDENAVLVGHDWGSFTVSAIAGYPKSPFRTVITMSAPAMKSTQHFRGHLRQHARLAHRQLRHSWYILFFQTPILPERVLHRLIPKFWKDWTPPIRDLRRDIDNSQAALCTLERRAAAINYYRSMVQNRKPAPLYAALNEYRFNLPTVPTLYVHGADDRACEPGYAEIVLHRFPPGSKAQLIPDAGHFLQSDNPRAVAAAILEFLDANGYSGVPSAAPRSR
jgi:pimeloyl-ACP methyl ester carboxylesterase